MTASLWPVFPPAGCGRPGWAGRTEVVPSTPACVTLREWVGRPTAGAAEHMQREGGREGKRKRESKGGRERGRREGQPILTPPAPHPYLPSPLAPCTATLHSPNPLSLTPQDANSWSAAQIPKFQIRPNRRRRNNNSQIHTLAPPSSYKMPPLTGPTTHLVSFKLNPCKSPKLSHPFFFHPPPPPPPPPSPPLLHSLFPSFFFFFLSFHKATKAFALVQSDMQDIYRRGERS